MDQVPTLWDKNSEVQNRLRQPKLNTSSSSTQESENKQLSIDSLIANSTLKADAPEWFPSGHNKNTCSPNTSQNTNNFFPRNVHILVSDSPRSSVQGRLSKFKQPQQNTSGNAVNPNLHQWQDYSDYAQYTSHHDYNIDDSPDTIRLKQIISSLISYPGQFDDLLMVFMETIYPYFDDYIALSNIARLLVTEAINCPNFRYNGARLCWNVEQICPPFRAELHMTCQKEVQENVQKQNVVLFIAELYTQLPHVALYGTLLINSLKQLLTSGSNENVKCACQALKLTGYSLDENNKSALDEVFTQLRALKNSVSGSALILLNSVLNLRESNWGRSLTDTSNTSSEPEELDFIEATTPNGVVYQTEDPLTSEEHDFLIAHSTHDEYLFDNEDPDELCDPEPEMDEEIQEAFKEFVRLSKR